MLIRCLAWLRQHVQHGVDAIRTRVSQWTTPRPVALAAGLAADLPRSRGELLLENALLRQQLLVLRRTVKRPALTPLDRGLLVLLASRLRTWAGALLLVQPPTVLRWHRQGFRLDWRRKSTPRSRPSPLSRDTIKLIKQMARDNPLWGAERIRGELLKLGFRVSKRTIQKYTQQARPTRPPGQAWGTFLRTHAHEIWACDFLQVTDLLFRPLFAFFIVELGSRRVVHVGVTRHPTDAWVAQQLREASPYGERPRFLLPDHDAKYGARFAQVAEASGIAVVRTPVRAPRANAITERFLRSVRQECLDHLLLLGEGHLRRALGSTSPTSTGTGRTRGAASGCRRRANERRRHQPRLTEVASSPARCSAGCTTPITAPPEALPGGHPPDTAARERPALAERLGDAPAAACASIPRLSGGGAQTGPTVDRRPPESAQLAQDDAMRVWRATHRMGDAAGVRPP